MKRHITVDKIGVCAKLVLILILVGSFVYGVVRDSDPNNAYVVKIYVNGYSDTLFAVMARDFYYLRWTDAQFHNRYQADSACAAKIKVLVDYEKRQYK